MTTEQERLTEAQLEAVMRRVAKLLAIAQDDRANPAEAAAAAGQAEKIMRKYQLEHTDVIGKRLQAGDDLATADVVATAKDNGTANKKVPPWAGMLSYAVGQLHDCATRIVWVTTAKGDEVVVRFFGYKADVQVAAWTYEYLVATVNRICREYRLHPAYLEGGRTVMNSYRQGVCQGVLSSINALTAEKRAAAEAAQQASVTGRSLVVIKEAAIAEKYGMEVFSSKNHKIKSKNVSAYADGMIRGRQVDVQRRAVGNDAAPEQGRLR